MQPSPNISEDAITAELETMWEFFGTIVDWDAVETSAPYLLKTYNGVSERLDGMSYDEKLMIHALLSLGATIGTMTSRVYVVVPKEDEIPEGELN